MNKIQNSKKLYWWLIGTFFILYTLVGFVSTLHSITFFQLANEMWLAVMLGITYEVGQAAVLFSILMSKNKNNLLPWSLMILLTALQVTANVYASFKFMDGSGSNDWTYWQRSILFWLEMDGPEMFKVVISWITGALLPVVALGMTALVAENIKHREELDEENIKEELKEEIKEELKEISPNFEFNKDSNPSVSDSTKQNKIDTFSTKEEYEDEMDKIKAECLRLSEENEKLQGTKPLETSFRPEKLQFEKNIGPQNQEEANAEYEKFLKNQKDIKEYIDRTTAPKLNEDKILVAGEWVDKDPTDILDIQKDPNTGKIDAEITNSPLKGLENDKQPQYPIDTSSNVSMDLIGEKNYPLEVQGTAIISDSEEPKKSETVKAKKKKVATSEKVLKDHKKPITKKRGWHLQKEYIDPSNGDVYEFGKWIGNQSDLEDSKSDPGKKE